MKYELLLTVTLDIIAEINQDVCVCDGIIGGGLRQSPLPDG